MEKAVIRIPQSYPNPERPGKKREGHRQRNLVRRWSPLHGEVITSGCGPWVWLGEKSQVGQFTEKQTLKFSSLFLFSPFTLNPVIKLFLHLSTVRFLLGCGGCRRCLKVNSVVNQWTIHLGGCLVSPGSLHLGTWGSRESSDG